MYKVDLDAAGLLRIEIAEFLFRSSAEALFLEVQRIAPLARARHGGVLRTIGIGNSMPIQTALVLDQLARTSRLMFAHPGDRAGLIIPSALLRGQIKRIVPWQNIRLCNDEAEAREWLLSLASPAGPQSD